MDKTATLYFRKIPRNVRDMYKAVCSKRGISMRSAILNHMYAAISEDSAQRIRLAPPSKRKKT